MAKQLKKKIEQLCGLTDLDWEARQRRATSILASPEWKQKLCNELIGLSFRELEQTLSGVASERQKKEDSYEKKLKTYSGKAERGNKHSREKSVRRDTTGTKSDSTTHKLPSRTLEQILAQVHAPRESDTFPGWYKKWFSMAEHSEAQEEESSDILSDPDNVSSYTEE